MGPFLVPRGQDGTVPQLDKTKARVMVMRSYHWNESLRDTEKVSEYSALDAWAATGLETVRGAY